MLTGVRKSSYTLNEGYANHVSLNGKQFRASRLHKVNDV